jgi:methionine-rich copper-binding protein CopC
MTVSTRRLARRHAPVAGLAAAAALAVAAPALGHAELRATSPADGATLSGLPKRVTATYGEPMGRVTGARATRNRTGNLVKSARLSPGDARKVVITLKRPGPRSQNGTYRVAWSVIGADGHPQSGLITFRVRR